MLDFQDERGEKSPMHVHPERLIYNIGSWKRKFMYADGRSEIAEGRGEVKWSPPLAHAGENIGETKTHTLTHTLFIELKDSSRKLTGYRKFLVSAIGPSSKG